MLHPWLIGAASVGVAAVIAIVMVTRHREPAATSVPTQMAQSQVNRSRKRRSRRAQPAHPGSGAEAGGSPGGTAGCSSRPPTAAAEAAALRRHANAPLYTGPLVRYSVLRSGPSGDAVRIEVVSQLAGNLALYRTDAAGQWQRVFPATVRGFR